MMSARNVLPLAALLAFAGCDTVRNAREAQSRAEESALAAPAAAKKVDLSGRSLEELVAYALTNRPSMAAAALAVKDARLAMKEIESDAPIASSTPWNAIGADVSARYSETSPSRHSGDFETSTRKGTASASLSVDLLLYDFGRNSARAEAQAETVVAAELSLAKEGFSVFGDVSSAYFTLLKNDALLAVAETNVAMYAVHLEQAREMLEVGEAIELDVLRAELDLATARESLVAASNDVATAGANLMEALGVEASAGGFAAVLGPRPGSLDETVRNFSDTVSSAAEAYSFASTNAPEVVIARAKLRAASARVDYAIADLLPSVSASVSLNWADPLWYWGWGVSAVETLFTGFRRTTAVDRAVVAMESAASDVQAAELALSADLELAVAERDNAREALSAARARVAQAKENLDTVSERYRIGEASRVDFTDAVSAYASALGNRVGAFYRGQTAEADLLRISGLKPEFHEEKRREEN
ncbi:MAG: TolC family protein [Kiritimatiellae bacterium]|nr:TolC family protein [Kiritimatiellia bacterium]